jgi:hypothetical protein
METPKPEDIAASLASIKPEQVVYPKLPGQKIQPPENGCLVGLRKLYATFPGNDRAKLTAYIDYCEEHLGRLPYTGVLYEGSSLARNFPVMASELFYKRGMKLYIVAKTFKDIGPMKQEFQFELKDIVSGRHDKLLGNYAEGAVQAGEKYGGFFITTMEESNGNWYYWGQTPQFIPAWRHIWEIFEHKGANRYATWVWECYPPETTIWANNPETYYPGDQYVDWIGFSAFARQIYPDTMVPFKALVNNTFNQMRKKHPQKPIMQAEFAHTNNPLQHKWIIDTYKTIKSMPAMKAAVFYDNVTPEGFFTDRRSDDDHTLNKEGFQAMKEIFKDPYWIMAK